MLSKYPNRVAWISIVTGFIMLCGLCVGTGFLVRWILIDAPYDLDVTTHVARGTLTISTPDDNDNRAATQNGSISVGESLSTDGLSQGHLTFRDSFDQDTVLATVQLLSGSQLELTSATRPLVGLGDTPYVIRLDEALGTININISPRLEREIRVELSGQGQSLRIDQPGYYLVTITETQFQVSVRLGQAVLIDQDENTKLIESDETGRINILRDVEGIVTGVNIEIGTDINYELIPNSLFRTSQDPDQADVPLSWGCSSPPAVQEPDGNHERVFFQDRFTEHFYRDGFQNAVSRCLQQTPVDVSSYESLRLRVTMNLQEHSLNGCGIEGSECVLMVRLTYRNQGQVESGDPPTAWIQGFYIQYNPIYGDKIRCNSCFNDHIQVNRDTWYTFISEDFVVGLPEDDLDLRPSELLSVEVYSSGHTYDAYVSEVALVGQDLD